VQKKIQMIKNYNSFFLWKYHTVSSSITIEISNFILDSFFPFTIWAEYIYYFVSTCEGLYIQKGVKQMNHEIFASYEDCVYLFPQKLK